MMDTLINRLYDSEAELPRDSDFYYQAIEEIESESVSAQIYCLLKQQNKLDQVPFFFHVRLKQQTQAVLNLNLFIKNQAVKLLDGFEERQINVIPLKGVFFAERYFGYLGARSTSDIDLLIKENDRERTIEIVKQLGFTIEEESIPSHFHTSFSKMIPGLDVPLTVEIHWDILKRPTSNLDIEGFWQEAIDVENYNYVKHFSDFHTFYLICLHGWRHNMDSKKYYLDIIQMISMLQGQIDYSRLFREAKRDKTLKRIKRTIAMVYQQYPSLDTILPLPEEVNVVQREQKKSETGLSQYWEFVNYQFFSYDSSLHSLREVYQWFIPNSFELAAELQYAKNESSYINNLLRLYRQRSRSFFKAMIPS